MTPEPRLLSEGELTEHTAEIERHFGEGLTWHHPVSRDGLTLSVIESPAPGHLPPLLIVAGRAEIEHKYAEFLYSAHGMGISVAVAFVRGNGSSSRVLPGTARTHLRDYHDLRSDIECCHRALGWERYHLMGFSMGGLIALDAVAHGTLRPERLALCAPYLHPQAGGCPAPLLRAASALCAAIPALSTGYPPTQGDYRRIPFAENHHSHSELRYGRYHDYYAAHPELCISGTTWGFLHETLSMQAELRRLDFALTIPTLAITSGADRVVNSAYALEFFNRHRHDPCPPICLNIDGAFHDLINESDAYRTPALLRVLEFFYGENSNA
ncbi:MAG: alpha/beta hydrolase [Succinivibrionaceae bacterium]|nr:alpha/beta hydrolase [Succinivibrionaceae bacterium]